MLQFMPTTGCHFPRNWHGNLPASSPRKRLPDDGWVELMVFYCEQAAGFAGDVGLGDGGYFDALVRMAWGMWLHCSRGAS
jgi:hypothetical protein